MKLLIDENLSPKVAKSLLVYFPDTKHVRELGLENVNDQEIWNYAKNNNFIIVSKDSDFHHKSLLFGFPPKIIWITIGNCSTKMIIKLILDKEKNIKNFILDKSTSMYII